MTADLCASAPSPGWVAGLGQILHSPVVLLGIGNPERGDDGVGSALARQLQDRSELTSLDGGTAPENLAGTVASLHPRLVLLADAVHWGGVPGTVRLFTESELSEVSMSTHLMSPGLLIGYLRATTGADVRLLGIQPLARGPNAALSAPCRDAVAVVAETLRRLLAEAG